MRSVIASRSWTGTSAPRNTARTPICRTSSVSASSPKSWRSRGGDAKSTSGRVGGVGTCDIAFQSSPLMTSDTRCSLVVINFPACHSSPNRRIPGNNTASQASPQPWLATASRSTACTAASSKAIAAATNAATLGCSVGAGRRGAIDSNTAASAASAAPMPASIKESIRLMMARSASEYSRLPVDERSGRGTP